MGRPKFDGIEDLDYLLRGTTYRAAHGRTSYHRGKAKTRRCSHPLCDRRAEQWSYDGNCPFEQEGDVLIRASRMYPEDRYVHLKWSPSIYAYTALCLQHHAERDRLQRQAEQENSHA